ncbi:hypothetical protein [Adlercreutzia sp. ZJ304]|uniref:hypothetical protein n=1 Tax=Adlercreutzia sp. ZJ304 TaxID=2709791 RepID=UPI0013ECC1C9|nr:hypothetical protein [Adlercreutzia sp. ZJ304]
MRKLSLPKRITSLAFAAALACTMVPVAAQTAAPETAYAAGAEAKAAGAQINVSTPFYVDFGSQSNPYDVAQPNSANSQAALTSTSFFENHSESRLALDQVECTKPSDWTGVDNSWIISADGNNTMDSSKELFSLWIKNENTIDTSTTPNLKFGYATHDADKLQRYNETINERFEFNKNETLYCAFRLNLDSASAKVNPKAANGAAARQGIGTVKFTFDTNVFTGEKDAFTTSATLLEDSLVIQDKSNGLISSGQIYSASQIKAQAKDLSLHQKEDGTNDSVYYPMYKRFVEDVQLGESGYPINTEYTAKVRWITEEYPIRVIGVCQDHLSSQNYYGSASNYAGLSFLIAGDYNHACSFRNMNGEITYTNTKGEVVTGFFAYGGWEKCDFRSEYMIPESENYAAFRNYIAPVVKRSTTTWTLSENDSGQMNPVKDDNGYCETEDKLFLLSAYEVFGELVSVAGHRQGRDGFFQYQWFNSATYGKGNTNWGTSNMLLVPYEPTEMDEANNTYKYGFRLRSTGESDSKVFKVLGYDGTYSTGSAGYQRNPLTGFCV